MNETELANTLKQERDKWAAMCGRYKQKLNEAREALKHIEEYGTEEINAAVELRQKLAQTLVDLDNMQDQRDLAMKVIKRLERERDEARSELSLEQKTLTIAEGTLSDLRKELKEWQTLCLWGGSPEHVHDFIKGQQTRIHEAQDIEKTCEQLERERDEAREQVKELIYIAGRAIDLAEIDFENDKFGIVSELKDGLKKIKEEAK